MPVTQDRHHTGKWLAVLVGMALCGAPWRAPAEEMEDSPWRAGASVVIGGFQGPEEMGVTRRESGWDIDNGMFLALGVGGAISRYAFLEYELVGWNATYRGRDGDRRESFTIVANSYASLAVKLALPYKSVRPYVGGSAGLFESSLMAEDGGDTESDWGVGYQLLAGTDFLVAKHHSLGIEVRRVYLQVDFGAETDGKRSFGGDVVALAYRYWFR